MAIQTFDQTITGFYVEPANTIGFDNVQLHANFSGGSQLLTATPNAASELLARLKDRLQTDQESGGHL
jgi:hypothetical protein